jgi:site-specific DNA recombinase
MRRGRQMQRRAGVRLPWTIPPDGDRVHPDRPRDPAGGQTDPRAGAIVQEWFARDLEEDGTLLGLAQYRRQLGITSPYGNKRWSTASLRGLLTNPASTGQLDDGRTRTRPARIRRSATHPLGKPAHSQVPTPPETWTLVATMPALVSQDTCDRVQAQVALKKKPAPRNHNAHRSLLRA